ncbi:MAG: peptidoglycan-binding protein [Clostridia bacterium]|nr:peptidoglycan-binding protein [Clostridia bacterium]
MARSSDYIIAANDEHGIDPPTVGKRTPTLPYINRSFYENEFNRQAKYYFLATVARCGFRTFDAHPELKDVSIGTRVRRVNSINANALITYGYNAYGGGLTFNSANGYLVFYSALGRYPSRSKLLSVDLSDGLKTTLPNRNLGYSTLSDIGVLESVNCPSSLVEAGFMTNFNEAKLMLNPSFVSAVAEGCAMGVCEFFETTYVPKTVTMPTIRRGNSSSAVKCLQYLLIVFGYNVDADGVFGPQTQNAVMQFQRDVGISADGIVGAVTWSYLMQNINRYPVLRRGSRGGYVNLLQRYLLSYLYPVGSIDGIFGVRTERAVRDFQSENGIASDGIVGAVTWRTLLSAKGRENV